MQSSKPINGGLAVCAAMLVLGALFPGAAEAYVGPGSGLAALGTLLALVGTVFLGIFGFIWFPIKRMFRAKRKDETLLAKQPETEKL